MTRNKGYKKIPLSFNRRMVGISASVTGKRNLIHSITEVDITLPREKIRSYKAMHGESPSFTAYLVCCLARVLAKHPEMNAFRRGNKLILLADVTVSVLVERIIKGESVPEPVGIKEAQKKTYRQIHEEIREAQEQEQERLGSLSKMTWVRFIPNCLMRTFFRLASGHIGMNIRYGVSCITAVGMFGKHAGWFIPHGAATVLLTVGSIIRRPVMDGDTIENREHLCLSLSFDHAIVDGAPAARFTTELMETIREGEVLKELSDESGS